MSAALDALVREALILPADQRVGLAHQLLSSVEPAPEPDTEAAWEAEIARRIARADAGETAPVPATEVFAGLRRIAPDPALHQP